jgi:hypothetical protein
MFRFRFRFRLNSHVYTSPRMFRFSFSFSGHVYTQAYTCIRTNAHFLRATCQVLSFIRMTDSICPTHHRFQIQCLELSSDLIGAWRLMHAVGDVLVCVRAAVGEAPRAERTRASRTLNREAAIEI